MELLVKEKDLDILMTPVGGGGLLSGTALAAHYFSPKTLVIGAEPAGADYAAQSFTAGKLIPSVDPDTICDGLLTSLGELNFTIISELVHDIITVDDEVIIKAMELIWERMKIIVEPSSAVPLALILDDKIDVIGKRVGIILSGGNIALTMINEQ